MIHITKGCKQTTRYNNDPNNQGISLLVSHMELELDAGQTAIYEYLTVPKPPIPMKITAFWRPILAPKSTKG